MPRSLHALPSEQCAQHPPGTQAGTWTRWRTLDVVAAVDQLPTRERKSETQAFFEQKKNATVTLNFAFTQTHLGYRLKAGHYAHEQRLTFRYAVSRTKAYGRKWKM
eukprot:5293046-Prymnesium_polylepis.2